MNSCTAATAARWRLEPCRKLHIPGSVPFHYAPWTFVIAWIQASTTGASMQAEAVPRWWRTTSQIPGMQTREHRRGADVPSACWPAWGTVPGAGHLLADLEEGLPLFRLRTVLGGLLHPGRRLLPGGVAWNILQHLLQLLGIGEQRLLRQDGLCASPTPPHQRTPAIQHWPTYSRHWDHQACSLHSASQIEALRRAGQSAAKTSGTPANKGVQCSSCSCWPKQHLKPYR